MVRPASNLQLTKLLAVQLHQLRVLPSILCYLFLLERKGQASEVGMDSGFEPVEQYFTHPDLCLAYHQLLLIQRYPISTHVRVDRR